MSVRPPVPPNSVSKPRLQRLQGPVSLPDLEATDQLARRIGALLRTGDVLALEGSLGAGKTTFARALLQSLGVKDDVPSPTFTLLQSYETLHFSVTHFDLYRIRTPDELDELGWDDLLASGVALVEWPERAGARLPARALGLHFSVALDHSRLCNVEAHGDWLHRLEAESLFV